MDQTLADMATIAAGHATQLRTPTVVPRMTLWCGRQPTDPTPAMFEPKFYVVLQGHKRMTIGGQTLEFGTGRYAVSAVGLPFTGQIIEASPERPYVGIEFAPDPGVVASLLFEMPDREDGDAPAMAVAEATPDIMEPLGRLLRLLDTPADVPVLAAQFERELYYRLLQGPAGGTLRQVVQQNTRFHQIRTAVEWICGHADQPMRVERLASSVGMSVTSFHRHFKSVTAHSPLAYQRNIRLLDARELLASGTTDVTRAAFATGYASSSQFSREYKRMFGVSPNRDALPVRH